LFRKNEKEENVVPDGMEVLEDVSGRFGTRAGSNSEGYNSDALVSKPLKQKSLVQLKKIEAPLIPIGNHPFLNLITFLY
jgi:hypothetical protein